MRYIYIILLISALTTLLSMCNNNSTNPPVNGGPDTTSHEFIWQIDTVGINQSYLLDVTYVNENDIWAVGEINTIDTGIPDSNGTIIRPYNAVHWNGAKWELHRLKTAIFEGQPGEALITAVYAFASNDIWMFSYAGSYLHWDGLNWKTEFVWEHQGTIYTIWGFSSEDLYFAGTNGSLTHYDGNSFRLLPTGTNLDIWDIWGKKNPKTGENEILALASDQFGNEGRKLLKIDESIQSLPTDGLTNHLSSIWFESGEKYYICGNGLYENDNLSSRWIKLENQINFYKTEIRGNNKYDVFMVGSFGLLSHYNGKTWYHYTNNDLPSFDGSYTSLAVNQDNVIVVGGNQNSAIILRGTRIETGE